MSILVRRWLRDAAALRGRLLVLVLVVALGTGFSVTLLQAAGHLRASYDTMYDDNQLAHLTMHLDAPRILDGDVEDLLRDHDARARSAEARLALDGNLRMGRDSWAARIIGIPDDWPTVNDICVLRGDFEDGDYTCTPDDDRETPAFDDQVYLHAPFADEHGITPEKDLTVLTGGSTLEVTMLGGALNTEFLVSTSHPEFLIPDTGTLAVLWVEQDWLQEETGLDGAVNQILVRFSGKDPEARAREVVDAFRDAPEDWADLGVIAMEVREDTFSYSLAEGDVAGFLDLSSAMALVVGAITAATVAVSMRRIVESQGHTIGVLRSLGASRRSITLHYLSLAIAVGVAGASVGLLIGGLGAGALARWYQGILEFPVLHESVRGGLFASAFMLAVLAAVAGGGPAARRAGRGPILSSLQPLQVRRPGRLLRRLTCRGSATRRMVLRNLTRRPRRSVYTLASLALAMVITLSMLGITQSMNNNISDQFTQNEQWDGIINLESGTFRHGADTAIRDIRAIEEAEPFLSRSVTVDDEAVGIRLVGLESQEMHRFDAIDGVAELETGQAIITRPMVLLWEETTGSSLAVGDRITLHHGTEKTRVTIKAIVQEPLGAAIYLPITDVQDLVGVSARHEADGYYVRAGTDDPDDDSLADIPGFIQYTSKDDLQETMESFTDEFREFSGIFALVGALFGSAVVINATTTNLDERKVENATLRALGGSSWTIRNGLLAEATLLALPAAVIGILLGLFTSWIFTDLLSRQLRASIVLDVPALTGLGVALGMMVVTLAATLTASRHLKRLDLAGLTKQLAR